MEVLRPHQEKIRVVLNKADTIDSQQLMRVYGALLWSLSRIVRTPEVLRVYIANLAGPTRNVENRALLEREKQDLLSELMALPQNAVVRRINELVRRCRSVKTHAYLVHYLRKQMPYVMGKAEKQAKLIARLDQEFVACARRYNLPLGDFPSLNNYRNRLREVKDISRFQRLDKSMIREMDRMLQEDVPRLLQRAQRGPQQPPPQQPFGMGPDGGGPGWPPAGGGDALEFDPYSAISY
mmetsp:Transcript_10299/g.35035  ORF Transcript_10299/g.35035 Transcript_10299/m.35035 type:complete len:238 (+) Transcript_10299:209-922(+)